MYCIDVLYVWEKIFVIYNESLGVREMEEKWLTIACRKRKR